VDAAFVILGAGQAGGWAAKTLRDQGHAGPVVLVGDETHPPHERPPLSKAVLLGQAAPETTHLWPAEKLAALGLDQRRGVAAAALDRAARRVSLSDGTQLGYGKLLIATGARPRRPAVAGADLPGIHVLRSIGDSLALHAALKGAQAVAVVGGGWIGLEVAAAARTLGRTVTVIEAADRLCQRTLPADMAAHLRAVHEGRGAAIRLGAPVAGFIGTDRVAGVRLADGETVAADLVVIGIGIEPNDALARAAGLRCDGGILVDACGRTADPDVFAAGDVARAPVPGGEGLVRLESWANAQNQGIAAAKAMLGITAPWQEIPWFWSDQYDLNIQLLGLPQRYDAAATRGSVADNRFMTLYLREGRIVMAAAVNQGRELRLVRRLMQADRVHSAAVLADPAVDLAALARR